jgi:hypothetical protein
VDELRVRALEMARDRLASAKEIQRVAKMTSQDAAAWAFGQWELRSRGRAKFERSTEMLFVREALEQATHEAVAAYHGHLFPAGELVADLTVGIGADLIALASRGPAVGFELYSERAEDATHNLAVYGQIASIQLADCTEANWEFDYAFADPARRVDSRRTLDPTEFSPNPVELAERMTELKLGVMKLSPLLPDAFLESLGPRLEFISYGGECREVLAIMGTEAVPGRFAVQVETGEKISAEIPPVELSTTLEYLYDADPAAVRGHALGTLCDRFGISPLGTANGYLTGDEEIKSPWFRTYRVLYTGKGDAKSTRKALKELDAEIYEIKQRGVKADLAKTKKELSAKGKLPVSLVLWPDGSSVRHSLVTRVD